MKREPLSGATRYLMRLANTRGDRSMICHFTPDLLGDEGEVRGDPSSCRVSIGLDRAIYEPDEARQLALALLGAADHAEYGSGEWRAGEWVPTWRHRG